MPAPSFLAGETLAASQLKLQTVHICTSGTRPTGFEGLTIYETDTDLFYVYSGSAWVPFGGLHTGTSHTPTLSQGASSNVAKTVTYSTYVKIGRLVFWQARLDVTASGTAGSAIRLTLPFTTSNTTARMIGQFDFFDSSASAYYQGSAETADTGTTVQGIRDETNDVAFGVNPNVALASGDTVLVTVQYITAG